jgi:hypothetical protein
MVRERFDDIEFGSAGHEVFVWRCLNCDTIAAPAIAAHHHTANKTGPDLVWRQRLQELMVVP